MTARRPHGRTLKGSGVSLRTQRVPETLRVTGCAPFARQPSDTRTRSVSGTLWVRRLTPEPFSVRTRIEPTHCYEPVGFVIPSASTMFAEATRCRTSFHGRYSRDPYEA